MVIKKKKDIPLEILENIQPIVDAYKAYVKQIKEEEMFYHLVDNDTESGFYFIIEKQNDENSREYFVEYRPMNKNSFAITQDWLPYYKVALALSEWINIMALL